MSAAQEYRIWVLGHFHNDGWDSAVDRIQMVKGKTAIAKLIKDGLLEKHANYELYRITPFGSAALTNQKDESR